MAEVVKFRSILGRVAARIADMQRAIKSGAIGALAVTALNKIGQRFLPQAPRLDILGMRLASKGLKKAHVKPPRGPALYALSFVGEMFSNSLFYALVGWGKARTAWLRGALLGLASGVAAVKLPSPMGVGKSPTARTGKTAATTIVWYVLGGLLAAVAYRRMRRA